MTNEKIEHGFWFKDKENSFPPDSIIYPKEYKGQTKVNIACTQRLDMTLTEQKKLIKEWIEFLPSCKSIEILWLSSNTTQQLFDSVCKLENLVGLNIKQSNIKTLDNILRLHNLKYLSIGSSSQVQSIYPIAEMKQLEVLRMENFKQITDFSPLAVLTNLKYFSIEGGIYAKQKVDSFEPFSNLKNLIYFSAVMISCADKCIEPLFKLKNLKTINWPFDLAAKEIDRLKKELPNLKFLPHRNYQNNMDKLKTLIP